MKSFRKHPLLILVFGFIVFQMSACDFQAAEDAFDDFNIIIGLDPINTVVNGIIVDASDGDLVSAELTFGGGDVSTLIDAYSDPLEDQNVEDGLITFGIRNSIVPSPSNPVVFTVRATADGYFSTSKTISVTKVGDAVFQLVMAQNNVTDTIPGTDGQVDNQIATNSSGVVQQAVTIQTQAPAPSQTQAQVTVVVPAGSTPVTANGTPLVGQITTQLRAYDSGSGLAALPSGAITSTDGTNQAIAGATFFKMEDQVGNVAVNFQSGSGKGFSKGSTICDANDTSILMASTDAALLGALTLLGGSAPANVFAYQPANDTNPQVGTLSLTLISGRAEAEICLGTVSPNIDTSLITDASGGIIYTFALTGAGISTGTLDNMVTITNPSGSPVTPEFTLVGLGMNPSGNKLIPGVGGSFPISDLMGETNSVTVLDGSTYVLTADVGGTSTAVDISNPLSGSSNLSLPSTSNLVLLDVTASVQCSGNLEFDVQVTDESLDAVTVFYRATTPGSSWTLLPGSAITSKSANQSSIIITGTISLLISTFYEFRGVLGTDSSVTTEQTPAAAGAWSITMDPNDIGFDCS